MSLFINAMYRWLKGHGFWGKIREIYWPVVYIYRTIIIIIIIIPCDKGVPVTTAWRVLSSRMEERPPIWRVAANVLNKQ